MLDHNSGDDRIGGVDGDGAESLHASGVERAKVKRLARHRASDPNDGVSVARQTIDRQSRKGPGRRLSRLDLKSRLLRHSGARDCDRKQGSECPSHSLIHGTKIHQRLVGSATAYPAAGTRIRWM
jgi:hypothetical protein